MDTTLPDQLREQAARLAVLGVAADVRAVLEQLAEHTTPTITTELGALGPLRLHAVTNAGPQHAVLACPACGHSDRLNLVERQDVRWRLAVEPRPTGWQLVAHAHTRAERSGPHRQAVCDRCDATWKIDDLPIEWR